MTTKVGIWFTLFKRLKSSLLVVCSRGYIETVKLLLSDGKRVDINKEDKYNRTPFSLSRFFLRECLCSENILNITPKEDEVGKKINNCRWRATFSCFLIFLIYFLPLFIGQNIFFTLSKNQNFVIESTNNCILCFGINCNICWIINFKLCDVLSN